MKNVSIWNKNFIFHLQKTYVEISFSLPKTSYEKNVIQWTNPQDFHQPVQFIVWFVTV